VLNALEVLQGKVSVVEVLNTIQTNRAKGIDNKVAITKNYAWDYQHINEQFDYLKLANLAREEENSIWLNSKEKTAIDYFIENLNTPLAIDYSEYDLSESNIGKKIELEWQEYFGNATRIDQT
jgi:hypothetical protein